MVRAAACVLVCQTYLADAPATRRVSGGPGVPITVGKDLQGTIPWISATLLLQQQAAAAAAAATAAVAAAAALPRSVRYGHCSVTGR
eukprot:COSAG06_NODE_33712_length_485_cov_1.069948_1_plen_86_part_10